MKENILKSALKYLEKNDYHSLKNYIINNPKIIDEKSKTGLSFVHYCALCRKLPPSIFNILYELGCDFNIVSRDKRTPLGIISNYPIDNKNKIIFLRNKGAVMLSIEQFSYYLDNCIPHNQIRLLIKNNRLNINEQGHKGCTLLGRAIVHDADMTIIKFLLESGADPNIAMDNGEMALDLVYHKDKTVIEYLKENGAKHSFVYEIITLIRQGEKKVINILEENPEYIHYSNIYGENLLHLALKHNCSIEIIKYLVTKGISPNSRCYLMQTPLHKISGCSEGVIKYIASLSNNLNALDDDDRTPLFWCITSKTHESALFLIKYGADPNYPLLSKETVLDVACYQHQIGSRMIIKDLRDKYGAKKYSKLPASCKIIDESGTIRYPKFNASDIPFLLIDRDENIIKLLKENSQLLQWKDHNENSLLHIACYYSCPKSIIRFLLSKKIPVNQVNKLGQTPLSLTYNYTFYEAFYKIISMLYKKGANLDKQDKQGHTLLYQLIKEDNKESHAIKLLELGADPNIIFHENKTILDIAIHKNSEAVYKEDYYINHFAADFGARTFDSLRE